MIKNSKLFAAVVALFFLCSLPLCANASPVNTNESLYNLTNLVEKEFGWYQTLGKAYGYNLTIDGDIEVTDNDTFYKVLIPNVSIYIRDINKHLNIGNIIANMAQSGSNIWKVKFSIPNLVTITNEYGELETSINFEGQKLSLIWLPEYKIYPEFKAYIENLQIMSENSSNVSASIKSIDFKFGLNPNQTKDWAGINKTKSWGGKSLLEMSDIKAVLNKAFSVKLDKLVNRREYKQLNPMGVVNNRVTINKFIKAKEAEEVELNLLDSYNMFSSLIVEDQGTRNNLEISNLDVIKLSNSNIENVRNSDGIILNRLQVSSSSTGIENGLFNSVNRIEFNNLSTSNGFTGDFTTIVPRNGVIPVSFRNIPARTLTKIAIDEMFRLADANLKPFYMRVYERIRPMMDDNSTYLSINNAQFKKDSADTQLSANLRINPHAVYKFSAGFSISFDGYDFVNSNLGYIAGEPYVDFNTLVSAFKPNTRTKNALPENFVSLGSYKVDILESGRVKVKNQAFTNKPLQDDETYTPKATTRTTWGKAKAMFKSIMPK